MHWPSREVIAAYGSSILRVWVAVLLILLLLLVSFGIISLLGNGFLQWFVVSMAFATVVGFVMEFARRWRE